LERIELSIDQEKQKEKIIQISRVTKVVTGGKRLAFRAAVVVGDEQNIVGVGIGKAREVPMAIRKAVDSAKKNLIKVKNREGTINHIIFGKQGASKILLKPAPEGTGIIAGGSVRVVLELAGYKNVVAKSLGAPNAINCAKATVNGLFNLKDEEEESKRRGRKIIIRRPGIIVSKKIDENIINEKPAKKETRRKKESKYKEKETE